MAITTTRERVARRGCALRLGSFRSWARRLYEMRCAHLVGAARLPRCTGAAIARADLVFGIESAVLGLGEAALGQVVDRQTVDIGQHLDRLIDIRHRFDPHDVFRFRQAIPLTRPRSSSPDASWHRSQRRVVTRRWSERALAHVRRTFGFPGLTSADRNRFNQTVS